ncbi:Crp/Fnr family transcriptional regulator [Brevundimonas sp.]|uniref:Crp/Fnr family transcriptional regulator n=1 Tax=Brevundimonas sp. TaxID=1871086 RepID=UPI0025D41B6F|nr:Crp/Fnr family transcriptional regulator [Brevundimonas sp.]
MMSHTPENRLIGALPPDDRQLLLDQCSPFEFRQAHVFYDAGDPIDHVHFIVDGVVSAVAVLADGRMVETVMVGSEGLVGCVAALAPSRAHSRITAQVGGTCLRIEAPRMRMLTSERPAIRDGVARFVGQLQGELEQSVACNALHRAEQRFAKWLLRCHDRVRDQVLHLTQEYLASMLGSQRTTVNEAAQGLQRAGAIAYSRGKITVLDREALERAACECYHVGSSLDRGVGVPVERNRTGT